jgi:rod shape-determining protein MreD
LLLALFVQVTFAPLLTVHGAMPSFAAMVVVLYALRAGVTRALLLGAIAGIVTDAFSGTGGGWTIAYLVMTVASGAVRARFFADGAVAPALLLAGAILVRNAIFWAVMTAEGYPRGYGTLHLHAALEQAVFTGAVTAVVQLIRTRFEDPATRIERYA